MEMCFNRIPKKNELVMYDTAFCSESTTFLTVSTGLNHVDA